MALSRKTRRYIVGGLIILFLVIAPVLILYARGYRYDFKEKEIQKVGMLMLAYDPVDASATVDGERAPFDITALGYDRFPDLEPGDYHIEIFADGYHSWSKNLDVVPEVVTWARYVTLFLNNNIPKNLVKSSCLTTQDFSPDRQWLCTAGQNKETSKIFIHSMTNNETQLIALSDLSPNLSNQAVITEISFAPDSTHILLDIENPDKTKSYLTFSRELTNEDPPVLLDSILPESEQVSWHPTTSSVVFAIQNQDLYRIALTGKSSAKRLASQVLGFDANETGLFFIRPREEQIRDEHQASLKRMGLDGSSPETVTEDIELTESYKIATSAAGQLAVLTNTNQLYIVIPSKGKTERIAIDATKMDWSLDNDEEDSTDELLLYANEHEIYVFDPLIQNSEAITRYTEKISNVKWYVGNYKYIIFTVGNKIKIIELDERDHRNIVDLWESPTEQTIKPDSLFLDNDAEHLFLRIDSSDEDFIRDFTIRQ